MTSHVYITINLFNLCQQSFLPFYIYFLKCWHRLNEPRKVSHKYFYELSEPPTKLACTHWSGPVVEAVQLVTNYSIRISKEKTIIFFGLIFVLYLLLISFRYAIFRFVLVRCVSILF